MLRLVKTRTLILFTAVLIVLAAWAPPVHAASGGPYSVYLPAVISSTGRVLAAAQPDCQLSAKEQSLAELMIADPSQQRTGMRCDPILARVAREKAEDMARRGYFGHVDPDGRGANNLVEQAGYILPDEYEHFEGANNIESLAADFTQAAWAWAALVESDLHRPHVLGEAPFFAQQIDYGIGYAYDPSAPYTHYWVILTANH